ncbi:Alpha-aminoadipic semialdehyde synthase [Hordeum vulgare]|nr:Alpha-aminoadipic semialdehyde synthase [Hordeum vulgare]
MVSYTIIPAIPDYVGKDIASDPINLEQEELQKTGDVASTMKGEEEKDNEEIGYAASNLKNEEEMAKKINAPWENAVSMEDEDVAEEVKSRDHA